MDDAMAAGADTLVTGDVKYHVVQKALNMGPNLVDGTHQLTELPVIAHLEDVLTAWCQESGRHFEVIRAHEDLSPPKHLKKVLSMIKDVRLGNDLSSPALSACRRSRYKLQWQAHTARGLLEDNSGTLPFICFEAGPINRLRTMEGPTPFIIGGRVDANKYASPMGGQNPQVRLCRKLFLPMGKPIYPCCCLQDPSTLSPGSGISDPHRAHPG